MALVTAIWLGYGAMSIFPVSLTIPLAHVAGLECACDRGVKISAEGYTPGNPNKLRLVMVASPYCRAALELQATIVDGPTPGGTATAVGVPVGCWTIL